MSVEPPSISVIIPVYNGERVLPTALNSIFQQKHSSLEIIIVDDGSTDKTGEIARSFSEGIKYIYQENQGAAAARNHGFSISRSKIIGFLDADDMWASNNLSRQLPYFDDSEVDLVMGQTQLVREVQIDDEKIEFENLGEPILAPLMGSYIVKKSVFENIGLFNSDLRLSEDVDWFFRFRESGVKIITVPQVSLLYRRHENNTTQKINHWQELNLMEVIKKSLDRRRKQSKGKATSLPSLSNFLVATSKDRQKEAGKGPHHNG